MKTIFSFSRFIESNVWIFLLLIFATLSKTPSASEEDVKYVNLYGNEPSTSGVWQWARDQACETRVLKNVSYEAHMAVWPYYRDGIEIDDAYVTNEWLMFPGTNYTDIRADLIAYLLVGLPKVTFYITKGLKPDCVYIVWKIEKAGPKWELKNHVCDLTSMC